MSDRLVREAISAIIAKWQSTRKLNP